MNNMNCLNIWQDRSSFLGAFPATSWHSHGSPVLLLGVSGRFELELRDGKKVVTSSAIVDAGVSHKVEPCNELMALFYLNTKSLDAHRMRIHYLAGSEYAIDVACTSLGDRRFLNLVHDFEFNELLRDSLPSIYSAVDERIQKSLRCFYQDKSQQSMKELAEKVGMSSSRYSHLFTESMGVSYRKYRQWSKLSCFYQQYAKTGNLTDAALLSGYSDSSHFSNSFKNIFGVAPSQILNKHIDLNIYF